MGNMLILVVEDEPSIAEVVSLYLRRAGFQVVVASDGWAALNALDCQLPSLIVLDMMLPGLDVFEITRRIRARGDIPIIILTARREEADRITGLEMGADDYVVKPFSPQELVSRVRAVLRRGQGASQESQERPLSFGDLLIDPQTRLVTVQGTEVLLTAREFDMLWLLARHPRQVFTRRLLRQIPNLTLVPLPESDLCCGSAGTYNIEQPETAHLLGKRKAKHILGSNAQAVTTGNIGCIVQIRTHLAELGQPLPVWHTLEVLDRAYRGWD